MAIGTLPALHPSLALCEDSPENSARAYRLLADWVRREEWTLALGFAREWLRIGPGRCYLDDGTPVPRDILLAERMIGLWDWLRCHEFLTGVDPARSRGWILHRVYGHRRFQSKSTRAARASFGRERSIPGSVEALPNAPLSWGVEPVAEPDLSAVVPIPLADELWAEFQRRHDDDDTLAPLDVARELYPGREQKQRRWDAVRYLKAAVWESAIEERRGVPAWVSIGGNMDAHPPTARPCVVSPATLAAIADALGGNVDAARYWIGDQGWRAYSPRPRGDKGKKDGAE